MCEMPQVYGCKLRKARKHHKCYECRGIILPGELYHYHHGVWDGQGASYKVCVDCEALRTEVDIGVHDEDLTAFGNLCDSVGGCAHNDNSGPIVKFVENQRKRGAIVMPWMNEIYEIEQTKKRIQKAISKI